MSTYNWKLLPKKAKLASLFTLIDKQFENMLSNPYCLLKIALKTVCESGLALITKGKNNSSLFK